MAATTDSNKNGEDHHHHQTISIWEVDKNRLAQMHQKLSTEPKILSKSAGRSSCSIYRVPQSLMDVNGRCYHPHIVSIGPYHHGLPHLQMIEEHKWRFLSLLLKRISQTKNLSLEDLLKAVQPLETRARDCYSETILLEPDPFIEILVLDGCFIIELFRKIEGLVPFEADDPLRTMTWLFSFFLRDFIRLENQIPFFVLDCLFKLTQLPGEEESGPSLATLTLNFFNSPLERPDHVIAKYSNLQGKHILDFLRSSFIPPEPSIKRAFSGKFAENSHVTHSISKLRRAGISLKPGNEESFLIVKFKKGVIEMPTISIDDFMSSFLLNCVAYEQCHNGRSKHMTTYAILLDCLINTSKDVEYLSEENVIENYFGTDGEVAKFINDLGKDVTFDIDRCYLANLFDEVNGYYHNSLHVQMASFKYTYFRTPWSFISALAAFILLVLTVLQTVYTMIGYMFPKH